jgi:hypothetical protein|tara:strand:+ start:17 stop:334 length:318 start_codon:yes stop_codon:yes gene_type:complete
MKKLILLLAITFSTSLFSQEKFDGNWIYEPSEYVLTIETKNNKLYLYNPKTKDTLSKTIVYQNKNEIMTRVTAVDGIYYTKYKFTNNDLVCVFQQNNYKITYKKQ